MEEKDRAEVEQPNPNGDARADAPPEGAAETQPRQLDELTRAYERARDELNDAVRTLRAEAAKIDLEQARIRARSWVDENPTLAVFVGVGAGILAGRLLSSAFRTEPPSLSERARYRATSLRGHAGDYADDIGEVIAYQAGRALRSAEETGDYVAHRGADVVGTVRKRAEDVSRDVSKQARRAGKEISRKAEEVGHDVSRRAGHLTEDASQRAEALAGSLSESADRSARALEDAVDELTKTLKKRSKKARKKTKKSVDEGLDFSSTVVNAARTAVAAVVVKKVSDWMRALR